jgi:hypothetical protein
MEATEAARTKEQTKCVYGIIAKQLQRERVGRREMMTEKVNNDAFEGRHVQPQMKGRGIRRRGSKNTRNLDFLRTLKVRAKVCA